MKAEDKEKSGERRRKRRKEGKECSSNLYAQADRQIQTVAAE